MQLTLTKQNLDHLVVLIPGFPVMKAVPGQPFEVQESFGHQIMATYPGCFTMGGAGVVAKVMPQGHADALPVAAKKKPGPKPKNKVIE
jgi:hypothetical protein